MLSLDIKEQVIIPALQSIGLYSEDAVALVWATGMVESDYQALVQHPGPAMGFWQMEPTTHQSLKSYLMIYANAKMLERILAATYRNILPIDDRVLIWDLRYAAIMCRMLYYRLPQALPSRENPDDVYQFYKDHYNSSEGAATYDKDIAAFRKACAG